MAVLLNDRNELIFSSASRITGAGVTVNSGPANTIVIPRNATVATPATITLTANAYGYITPAFTWSYRFGDTGVFVPLQQITNPITLNLDSIFLSASQGFNIIQYRAIAIETTSNIGINQSEHTLSVPILREGQNGLDGINSAQVILYKRTTTNEAPLVVTVGNSTYTFSSAQVVGEPSGWTQTIPPSSEGSYLWVIQVLAAGVGLFYAFANTLWTAPNLFSQDGVSGVSTALIYAYKRSATPPEDNPGGVAYSFTNNTISNYNLANGWSKSIPSGEDPLYVIIASASSNTSSDIIDESEWTDSALLVRNGTAGETGAPGAPGINTATIFLYARNSNSTTAPVFSSTGTATYTFDTGILSGTIPSGWIQSIPPESGGSVIWAIQATAAANTVTDTIPNNTWSTPRVLAERGTIGTNGVRGSRQLFSSSGAHTLTFVYLSNPAGASSYAVKATALIATATVGSIPTTPIQGDTVTFTNGTNFAYTITYNSSTQQWALPGTVIDGSLLVTGSVTAAKINSTGLSIRSATGELILDAGTGDFSGNLIGSINGNTAESIILSIGDAYDNAVNANDNATAANNNATTAAYTAATANNNAAAATTAAATATTAAATANTNATVAATAAANAASAATAASAASAAASAASAASLAATAATAANNNANNRLSKTTADILSATISVNAVTGAGFRAGNLTWDSGGNRTGGSGVAMTPGGLLGHNGSKTTFAINSLTGDAVFGGTVEAALLRSTDNKFIIDLANKFISITI